MLIEVLPTTVLLYCFHSPMVMFHQPVLPTYMFLLPFWSRLLFPSYWMDPHEAGFKKHGVSLSCSIEGTCMSLDFQPFFIFFACEYLVLIDGIV